MEHFTEPVTLAQVAGLASMNGAAFCRYFKSQTGRTLTRFILDLRIRYACELLSRGEESVTQVSYQVGFDNPSHFVQAFKKVQKMTPLAFRRRYSGSATTTRTQSL
jgi:AraC-like DNA-binding protein